MALPPNVGYCTITGRFIRAILDGPDPDREPDGVPIPGLTITLRADLLKPRLRDPASKNTILFEPIQLTTNANGEVVGPDMLEGVKIVAGDNPALGIFTWTATIQGVNYPRDTLTFDAPTGGTRDLSDLVEVPPSPGATLTAWLDAKNATLAARDEVLLALENSPGTSGAVASVNGQTGAIVLSATDIGAQPAGSYATTSALASGLAGKQAAGDYATNTALTSGLSARVPASQVLTDIGPAEPADKLVTLGALARATGYWPEPIIYNTGTSSWPARSSVVPAWFTGWAYWWAKTTIDVAEPADIQGDPETGEGDEVIDKYAA